MKTCDCRDPSPHHDPRKFGSCIRCGGKVTERAGVHIEHCRRCRHRFNTLAEGHAGISFVYEDGWGGDRFRQAHLCPTCRDELRSWIGMAPAGVEAGALPEDYR